MPLFAPFSSTGNANGQTTMANSAPVVIASDQSTLVIKGGVSQNGGVPVATSQLGVLPAIANASSPSFTEGNQVLLSANLTGNMRVTLNQVNGQALLTGNGVTGTGSPRVTIASDNTAINVNTGTSPISTSLNTFSVRLTTNTTTTPVASTAYISSIAISSEIGGTTSTVTIQDKQGTPLKLVNGLATTALTTAPTIINFQTPVKMVSGIDIITAGAVAATIDVWVNYYN